MNPYDYTNGDIRYNTSLLETTTRWRRYTVDFPTAHPTTHAEHNTVRGEYWRPQGVKKAPMAILVHGMGVCARHDNHAQLAASGDEIAKRVPSFQPGAPVVQRNPGGIVRNTAAGAEARGIGVNTLEVVEPCLETEPARIILDQRQLRPSHGALKP